jgi:outer membrane protein assembly factor BamB
MQSVELTEEGAPADEGAPTAGTTSARHGRRAGTVAGIVLILVGALLVGQAVLDARHHAAVLRIAALPGAVAPVPDEPGVRWTLDPDLLAALRLETPVALADGSGTLLVGAVTRPDATVEAAGVDASTGARRWTAYLTGAAREEVRTGAPGTGCVVAGSSRVTAGDGGATGAPVRDDMVLSCLLTFHHADDGVLEPPRRAQVVVIDALTGGVLARHPVPARSTRLAVVDGMFAVASRVYGEIEVEARDLLTGTLRWRASLSVPRSGTPSFGGGSPRAGRVLLQSAAGLFVVAAGQRTYLLSTDGEQRSGSGRYPAYVRAAARDRLVLLVVDRSIGSLVVRPAFPDQVTTGAVALPTLDDGSADVVLTVDDGLRGRDPVDGRVLWRVEGRDSGLVVLDGVAYQVTDRDLLRAVDLATGTVLWRVPSRQGSYGTGVVTDGERLYVEARSVSAAVGFDAVLLAYGLDGRAQAEIRPPAGWHALELRGGVLVATSDDGSLGAVLG